MSMNFVIWQHYPLVQIIPLRSLVEVLMLFVDLIFLLFLLYPVMII